MTQKLVEVLKEHLKDYESNTDKKHEKYCKGVSFGLRLAINYAKQKEKEDYFRGFKDGVKKGINLIKKIQDERFN